MVVSMWWDVQNQYLRDSYSPLSDDSRSMLLLSAPKELSRAKISLWIFSLFASKSSDAILDKMKPENPTFFLKITGS